MTAPAGLCRALGGLVHDPRRAGDLLTTARRPPTQREAVMPVPVDVVDRKKPTTLHGVTWNARADAMLDHIAQLTTDRDNALNELLEFFKEHPDLETDPHLTKIGLALL